MIRTLPLLFALAAPAAQACAVAEGCPMGGTLDACAAVRVAEGFACIAEPSSPAGFVIVPEDDATPAPVSTAAGVGAALAVPVAGLLLLLGAVAAR